MSKHSLDALWAQYEPLRVAPLKTAKEERRKYTACLQPLFGTVAVGRINMRDIEQWKLRSVETPYQFNRALNLLSTLLRYAEAMKWLEPGANPCQHVKRFPERKRRRHLTGGEAPVLYALLNVREGTYPRQVLLVWLMIFTGARPSELMAARWGQLQGNVLTLPDHKTSDKSGTDRIIVLPKLAMDKLALVGGRGHQDTPIVGQCHYAYMWRSICKDGKFECLRLYDMRHTFATYALAEGYTLDQIGEALEHSSPQTTKIYAEMSVRSRNKMAFDASVAILRDMQFIEEDVPDVFL